MPDTTNFTLRYTDEDKYEYNHRDGTTVKVTIHDRRNGGRVGVYHYDEDGTRLNYYVFNIRDVEHRELVASGKMKEKEMPETVAIALHAGGWQIANMRSSDLTPDPDDPVEVQLLDMRDGFREFASQSDTRLVEHFFEALARATEIGAVTDTSIHATAEAKGVSPEAALLSAEEAAAQNDVRDVELDVVEQVKGSFINAADPTTQRSTEKHDEVVAALETARDAYRQGAAFGAAFEAYYRE